MKVFPTVGGIQTYIDGDIVVIEQDGLDGLNGVCIRIPASLFDLVVNAVHEDLEAIEAD